MVKYWRKSNAHFETVRNQKSLLSTGGTQNFEEKLLRGVSHTAQLEGEFTGFWRRRRPAPYQSGRSRSSPSRLGISLQNLSHGREYPHLSTVRQNAMRDSERMPFCESPLTTLARRSVL